MSSLQYVIDSICARLTVESLYELIEVRLRKGASTVGEILPFIRCEDRSLDFNSAKMLAEAALEELAQSGDTRIEGDCIYPVT